MSITTPTSPVLGTPLRPYRRAATSAVLGGVCAGLAIRLGVRERTVRVVTAIVAVLSGLGLVAYVFAWLFATRASEDRSIARRLFRAGALQLVVAGFLALVIIVITVQLLGRPSLSVGPFGWSRPPGYGVGLWLRSPSIRGFTAPILVSLVSLLAVWRGASPDERRHLVDLVRSAPVVALPTHHRRGALTARVVLGVVLIVVALASMRHVTHVWGGVTPTLVDAFVLLVGVVILLAPWWLTTLNDLSDERRERVRVEERARVAAHLHDSVLQTLTLIQRTAGDESAVVRIARNQERELRRWLFDYEHPEPASGASFSTLLRDLQYEIENDYGVRVELVSVGECEADERVSGLVAAAREAAINAARWSGETTLSIYGEVETSRVSLFVRDRGRGFDVDAVASDRHGIELSIRRRLHHLGGSATVKSRPGEGTDVELSIERT